MKAAKTLRDDEDNRSEAFGRPGTEPKWTSSSKEGVGTSLSDDSPVWFTLAYGIINEIYFPRVDCANTRDAQYLITDGKTFFHEERRDLEHHIEYADPRALFFRQTNRDPQGSYQIVKETLTDPSAPVVLIRTQFESLKPDAEEYKIYALVAPHLGNQGMGNNARVIEIEGKRILCAERSGTALAVVASVPFTKLSCGFIGVSDGWTDLHEDFEMDWQFESATDGNVALTAELDTRKTKEWTLAISFGANAEEAARAAIASLARGWDAARSAYVKAWRDYCATLEDLSPQSGDKGRTFWTSAMLLHAHEDRRHAGAVCASLSIPWGEIHGDQELGGYHLVWARDLCQTASGALACGDTKLTQRIMRYLASIQLPTGGMPQNNWVDGKAYWTGVQLDEAAFPVVLAWRLETQGLLDGFEPYEMVKRAAEFLIKHGPASQQERWEEEAGISPSSLAIMIVALVCAGEMARVRNDVQTEKLCFKIADFWASNVERWTFTTRGTLVADQPEHYVRLEPLDEEALGNDRDPNCGVVQLNNVPDAGSRFHTFELIDGGFLELMRYGVRAAEDEHMTKSVAVYDKVLRRDTRSGAAWRRYNHDGYGQKADGSPFDGTGVGRAWALLTGERGHYEIAAGRSAKDFIKWMENFANAGAMLPEQIWDEPDIPEKRMYNGRPSGSAMPLVWAHAEYIRLLRSERDGKVFDGVAPVFARYVEQGTKSDLNIWQFGHKLRAALTTERLRIEVYDAPARVRWTADEWAHEQDAELTDEGLGVYALEFAPETFRRGDVLKFTFYWTEAQRWEERDFEIAIS